MLILPRHVIIDDTVLTHYDNNMGIICDHVRSHDKLARLGTDRIKSHALANWIVICRNAEIMWDHMWSCETWSCGNHATLWITCHHVRSHVIMWDHMSSCEITCDHVGSCEITCYHVGSHVIMWKSCESHVIMWVVWSCGNHVKVTWSCEITCNLVDHMWSCEITCDHVGLHVLACWVMWSRALSHTIINPITRVNNHVGSHVTCTVMQSC